MQFDNKQFEQGVKSTLGQIDALNKGLKFEGATKGLSELGNISGKFSMAGIGQGIDAIAEKFRALSIIGITALTNISNRALNAGLQLTKSLTIQPIQAGFQEYETNLNAIQ